MRRLLLSLMAASLLGTFMGCCCCCHHVAGVCDCCDCHGGDPGHPGEFTHPLPADQPANVYASPAVQTPDQRPVGPAPKQAPTPQQAPNKMQPQQ